jgi:hypothetical protein
VPSEDVARVKESYTGQFLRDLFARRSKAKAGAGGARRQAAE